MKTLVLIRHGHRDTLGTAQDNGLSQKGRDQAIRILTFTQKKFPANSLPHLFSSPKKRCLETIDPLTHYFTRPVQVVPNLLEQSFDETVIDFKNRISQFFGVWEKSTGDAPSILCSHSDWIQEALRSIVRAEIELQKGGWVELGWNPDGYQLLQVIQELS